MLHRLAKTSILLISLVFLLTSPSLAQDPGVSDTVRISSATGTPGGKVILSVTGYNDEDLAAVLIPLRFPSSSLVAESISYIGSRLSGASIQPVFIDSTNQTLSFGGVYFGAPLPPGDGLFAKIYFSIKSDAVAETVVIDTLFSPPSVLTFIDPFTNEWTPQFKPGKISIELVNLPPVWVPIGNKSVLEGETLKVLLKAKDPTFDPLIFVVLNGPPGSNVTKLTDSTALFTWVPSFVGPYSASGNPFKANFTVSDGVNFVRQDVTIFVINKNVLPLLVLPDTVTSPAEVNLNFQVSASDQDKELISITSLNLPSGASFDGLNPGIFNWTPSEDQVGIYQVGFEAVDASGGRSTDTVVIIITKAENFILSLPDVEGFSGEVVTLPLSLVNKDSVGGCQLLLHYDPSALVLKSVTRTGTRTQNWESFSVVLDQGGNQGDIKIVGIANLPNQISTPPLDTGQGPITKLTFQISENPIFAGFKIPVIFKFTDQLDNTLSDHLGNLIEQTSLTYKSGSVLIKSLTVLLGDINLNGFAFDIGDAVQLANYFIDPVGNALNAQQIANSDVNQDGITASIADLVFLIRRIVEGPGLAGLVQGVANIAAGTAEIELQRRSTGTKVSLNSSSEIGGLHFVFRHAADHAVVPEFSSQLSDFDAWYSDQSGVLRIIIFNFKGNSLPSGSWELFTIDDSQAKIEELGVSSAAGYLMQSFYHELTAVGNSGLTLEQNYPNPFNQETQIAFYLAKSDQVRLEIYNIRGQKVKELVDQDFAVGRHVVRWDGKNDSGENVATGIYLYRLVSGGGSMAKKLIFIK
ncbi:MAG: hypothetical protein A2142_07235 [candidate division Zixibacteria bacterium RBG_16_48_11]|nr:MAG: hypothetical protein A2142_07235 [candidate division Zixibacteria bacterium RBG_16_48_11]